MSIKSKIQALITAANNTTGESDTTLTDAVQTLVDGYGQGGGGGNQNTQQTVTGTAANPWGNVSYSELAAALASGDAHAVINVQMGETVGRLSLISNEGLVIYAGNAAIRSSLSDSDCATFSWGANGSIIYVHAISGGQYQDYTAYAAGMQTSLTIYWHPMP